MSALGMSDDGGVSLLEFAQPQQRATRFGVERAQMAPPFMSQMAPAQMSEMVVGFGNAPPMPTNTQRAMPGGPPPLPPLRAPMPPPFPPPNQRQWG